MLKEFNVHTLKIQKRSFYWANSENALNPLRIRSRVLIQSTNHYMQVHIKPFTESPADY